MRGVEVGKEIKRREREKREKRKSSGQEADGGRKKRERERENTEKEKVVGKRSEKRGYIETVRKVSKNQFDVGNDPVFTQCVILVW